MRTRRRSFGSEAGQSVVIVALMFTILMGSAAMAVDVGRFYAERRFLQAAVDAASLACAKAYVQSGLNAQTGWDAANDTLISRNLTKNPLGISAAAIAPAPRGSEVYDNGIVTPLGLNSGILPAATPTAGCRVAVTVDVPTYFVKLLSPGLRTIAMTTRAYAHSYGGMLPIVVNRYKNPPGPSSTFLDYTKQETYQLNNPNTCSEGNPGVCPDAAPAALGCTSGCLWGPETIIVGQGYDSSDSDFRGFIALDVREFTPDPISGTVTHHYYNDTLGMNSNQLKLQESSYVTTLGYPGPDLIAYDPTASPVQPGLQIGSMSGNSSGVVVDAFNAHYRPGDLILGQVFDGQVRIVPDFSIDPISISAASPSGPANGPTFRVGANQAFRANSNTVTLTMLPDTFNGTSNDTPSQLHPFSFSPNSFTPAGGAGTSVTVTNLQVDPGLASGIYSVIVSGTGYNPLGTPLATHQTYAPLNVGGVTRDFALDFTGTSVDIAVGDPTAVLTASLTTTSGTTAWNTTNAVSMALDQGTCVGNAALVDTTGTQSCVSATVSPSSAVPNKLSPPAVTVTFQTSGLPSGTYSAIIRARGTNGDGQPVVHVVPLQVNVGTSSGTARTYVNVQGYAVFMITTMSTNTIYGRAVSGSYANPTDANVALGRIVRLVPWETP